MKPTFPLLSTTLGRWGSRLAVAIALSTPVAAHASARALVDCLNTVDVGCADEVLEGLDPASSTDPELLYMAARAHFFAGRFDQAAELIVRAVDYGYEDRWDEAALYRRTRDVAQDFTEERRGRYIVRYRPGLDRVLVDDAFATLETAEKHFAPLLGGPPPAPIVAEIYPTGKAFTQASSLTEKDVKTTGVVALSKWSRLLVTSPRALGRGYTWQDTLAHEYIHQVVSHHTAERAPVWLQEGIAKYLDSRWRDGKERFKLDPRAETLVADALDSGQLVPFEMMHPSLAKLPTAEMSALAYAQLATLIQFVFSRAGEDVLPGVMAQVRRGVDPRVALSSAAGFGSFEELEAGWRDWIRLQGLQDLQVEHLPTALDEGGDTMATDPVMAARKDLARFVRLGELLLERGHAEAALMELAKADGSDGDRSPLLQARIAQAHLALGDHRRAREALQAVLELYPDFTEAWRVLYRVEHDAGRFTAAREAASKVVALDPFDLDYQRTLVRLYERAGDPQGAARHRAAVLILSEGG